MQPLDFLKKHTQIHADWYNITPIALTAAYRALFAVRADVEQDKIVWPKGLETKIFKPFEVAANKTPVVFVGEPPTANSTGILYEKHKNFFNTDMLMQRNCLLLPRTLTRLSASSHTHDIIWDPFTTQLLKEFSRYKGGICFVLIGGAKKLREHIDDSNHVLLCKNIEAWTPQQRANYLTNINNYLNHKSIPTL